MQHKMLFLSFILLEKIDKMGVIKSKSTKLTLPNLTSIHWGGGNEKEFSNLADKWRFYGPIINHKQTAVALPFG